MKMGMSRMMTKYLLSATCVAALTLSACGGGGSSSPTEPATPVVVAPPATPTPAPAPPPPPPPPPPAPPAEPQGVATEITSKAMASHVLAEIGFGGSMDEIDAAVGRDAAELVAEEFAKPYRPYLPRVRALFDTYADNNGRRNRSATSVFWRDMVAGEDQLRQRTVFALSQLWVVSDTSFGDQPMTMGYYLDQLGKNAFGNYRDLMEDITYSPAMGHYLTYRGNRKGNANTGRTPDENYAREILQLFTTGLVELNMDGTPKLANGEPIEVYDNDDIIGLARVFTGLDLGPREGNTHDPHGARRSSPMVIYEDRHSPLEKTFLGTTIPAGTNTADSIDIALDTIFEHPNVPPFVARYLIQRFTASHPDPGYVERVATAFATGNFVAPNGDVFGKGERGDMKATLAAILLDQTQFQPDGAFRSTTDFGKVREPVLDFVHWARAFEVSPPTTENEWILLYNSRDSSEYIGQLPLHSPSVFNFYRPGFVAIGTESGNAGLTVPEFQLLLSGNRSGYVNMMTNYAFDRTTGPNPEESFTPDYSEELAIHADPAKLADHLDTLLLAGRMSDATREAIEGALADVEVRTANADHTTYDEFTRVGLAVTLAVTSPEFMIR